jgi:hypothetical protein
MPNISLDRIKPNPFRDFDLHPIDEMQVQKLKASIDADGFWSSVVARSVDGGGYEIAFGHHRIEAARRLETGVVPIEVRDLSDVQMVRMLASENATQRGTTAAASLDAISAIAHFVLRECDRCETPELLGKILPISLSLTAAERIWGHIRNGGLPGRDCIQAIAPEGTFAISQIDLALSVLRDSGRLGNGQVTFDASCARMFKRDYHLAEFRRYVTDETIRSYLPVEQQYAFAQKIVSGFAGELTAIKLRERANILFYEQAGVDRSRARRSSLRIADARIKDALNLMRRGVHDIKKSCDLLRDLMAEGAEVAPEVVGRFTQYVGEIDIALRSLTPKGDAKRGSNLRLIVNPREDVA